MAAAEFFPSLLHYPEGGGCGAGGVAVDLGKKRIGEFDGFAHRMLWVTEAEAKNTLFYPTKSDLQAPPVRR